MEHYPSSSTTIVGALLLAAIICWGGASTGNAQLPDGPQFPSPVCYHGADDSEALGFNWAYYVEQVLSARETTTPNTPTFSAEFWYPENAGCNPRGSATCSKTLDVANCEACLSGVKENLDACTGYADGTSANGDCSMTFSQIGA